jgi:cytoskeletal protein CcmA (bactofilin family)
MGKSDKEITFLGKDTEFEGSLRFEGTLRIDGSLQGEINSPGNLIIGEYALVKANIHVSYIVISGEVHGDIVADQRVDLRAPAKVFGNIVAPAVVMDAGVIFEGHTRMYQAREVVDEPETPMVGVDDYRGGPPEGLTAIYGMVTDLETGKPLKKVEIECKGLEKKKTETNSSGYYELINLKEGEWNLKAEVKGYRKEKANVVVSGEGTFRQNFELTRKTGSSFFRGKGAKNEGS